ncbi:ATP-grasp domain-containing protein [Methanosalsum natronophilum]|uniref:RimK family alpha-L-glutamate ligase n=1 Tax=Methanosalsum natronophilum TaxID=768733 RepID=A0A3R7W9W6_9EURY|nr:RimK family alpha-L-glutamate ligase [Methanosalsum natronophilum]MCS3923184.1 tetrahydromethanopterin:alpha-L-glutamate ligase [Methanosalsum natronophilum]RQD79805.1 MAG: RimK family alpha-L-glutamate ligase [Methanosalsum natronophilum]
MKKIGVVLTDKSDWTAVSLIETIQKMKHEAIPIDLKEAYCTLGSNSSCEVGSAEKVNLFDIDAIVVRDLGHGTIDEIAFRSDILLQMQQYGIPLINSPQSIQIAANKYYSTYLLSKNGLPHPLTYVHQQLDHAIKTTEQLTDCILKPMFGYQGRGIKRIKNGSVLNYSGSIDMTTTPEETIQFIIDKYGIVYIQEFVESYGTDIRCFVVNNNVVGAIERTAHEKSWLSNLSQGSIAKAYNVSEDVENLACKASSIIGTDFAGIDIIIGSEGPKILEVNGTPSGAGIYRACNINVTEPIIEYLTDLL